MKMLNFVDTVEDGIQNAILTTIDSNITPESELAIRSMNASSGRDATGVTANSERAEHIMITVSFENNVSERNTTLHVFKTNDESRDYIPDKISELSAPGAHLTGNHRFITSIQLHLFPPINQSSQEVFFSLRYFLRKVYWRIKTKS